jgi:serine/threonine-protein kinase
MTPQRLEQIEEVYHSTRDRAPGERAAFLAEACGGDQKLRQEVEALLRQDKLGGVFERPALEVAVRLLKSENVGRLAAGAQLGPYQSSPRSAEAAWAKSTGLATRAWAATWR